MDSHYSLEGKDNMEEEDLGKENEGVENDDSKSNFNNVPDVEGDELGLQTSSGKANSKEKDFSLEFDDDSKSIEFLRCMSEVELRCANSYGGGNDGTRWDVNLNLDLIGEPSSSSTVHTEQDNQNKRAKLQSLVLCPQLETLSLKRSGMPNAVLNCPLLRELDIASCHKLLDAAIRSAVTSCPLLESLDISNCSCVSDETLQGIAFSCANLHILDASYCPNISLESVTLSMLTVLKLHSCEGITSASMAAVARSSILEVLELDNCSLLISVSLDLPCLQSIRLVHCRKFVDLNLRSSALSSITVSNCPSLQTISIASNALKK